MEKTITTLKKLNSLWLVLLTAIILLRVVPHIANAVPIFALLTTISSKNKFSKVRICLFTFFGVLLSDLALSLIHGYPLYGYYSIFTYTGYFLVIACSPSYKMRSGAVGLASVVTTVLFWTWTNLGVWLVGDIYPLNLDGLYQCYLMALPFLYSSLLANVVGAMILHLLGTSSSSTINLSSKKTVINTIITVN